MKVKVKLTKAANAQRHKAPLDAVVVMDVERYLHGVLPAILDGTRAPAPEKCALAIAVRTYAVRHALDGEAVSDAADGFPYAAAITVAAGFADAIERTRGQVLAFGGCVIHAHYCRSNGGRTRRSRDVWPCNLPYYKARADPWDAEGQRMAAARNAAAKPGHGVGLSLAGAEYAAMLGESYADILAFYYPGTVITNLAE